MIMSCHVSPFAYHTHASNHGIDNKTTKDFRAEGKKNHQKETVKKSKRKKSRRRIACFVFRNQFVNSDKRWLDKSRKEEKGEKKTR